MDTSLAGLVPHRAGIRPVAKKDSAVQRDPLAAILGSMRAQPLLLSLAAANSSRRREVCNGHVETLFLDERKRFKRAEQPVFEYGFQFAHHHLIVAAANHNPICRSTRCEKSRSRLTAAWIEMNGEVLCPLPVLFSK